ncbi:MULTISPECIES: hypothetical protein [Roseobacteraceae]|uniref:hypothetical protein n=1 Tax=Roseobacteraceae TaxID=2854170 RepID=UPI001C4463DE|nr:MULTISPECIES: hypothetical protein [Roseobacteraceae]MBV7408997.1 hypothetical protein [Maritimibacter sp. DP1N21-5]MBY5934316.1 hypothetical protein [Tateyamaria omphalii]
MSKFAPLKEKLKNNGWDVETVCLSSDCWWAKEIWRLTPKWSPLGRTIYLSFLLDPLCEYDDNNPPDEAVWAVNLASEIPMSRPLDGVSAKARLSEQNEKIVALAATLREEN